MGRSSRIDWLPHYREVLVATAMLAVREQPLAVRVSASPANGRAWSGARRDADGWRAAAVAAGAIRKA
jgi:hypothetical protein